MAAPSQLFAPPNDVYKDPMAPDTDGAAAAWIAIFADCCWREEVALPDEAVLVEAGLGDTPVAVVVGTLGDVELALAPPAVFSPAVGELDATSDVELPAPATEAAEDGNEEVDIEEDVAGAPNALAVGMSTSVRDAADTPSS